MNPDRRAEGPIPVKLAVSDEAEFTHDGYIDFADNRLDAQSGTLLLRAVMPNPNGYLTPGLFGRVQVDIGRPYEALLVPDVAIQSDQTRKVVMTVDAENTVVPKPVELGDMHGRLAGDPERPDRRRQGRRQRPDARPARSEGRAAGRGPDQTGGRRFTGQDAALPTSSPQDRPHIGLSAHIGEVRSHHGLRTFLRRSADLRFRDFDRPDDRRRRCAAVAADRPIPGNRPADDRRRGYISGRQCRNDRRDGRCSDRTGDQRRRGHDLHDVAGDRRRRAVDHRHLRAGNRSRQCAGAGAEPGGPGRAASARRSAPQRGGRQQAVERLPDARQPDLARRFARCDLPVELRHGQSGRCPEADQRGGRHPDLRRTRTVAPRLARSQPARGVQPGCRRRDRGDCGPERAGAGWSAWPASGACGDHQADYRHHPGPLPDGGAVPRRHRPGDAGWTAPAPPRHRPR